MKGSSVIRPLFNVFPDDIIVRDSSDEFFWGDAIMVAPVLYEGAVTRDVYFPEVRRLRSIVIFLYSNMDYFFLCNC